jgi:hypothetical protein
VLVEEIVIGAHDSKDGLTEAQRDLMFDFAIAAPTLLEVELSGLRPERATDELEDGVAFSDRNLLTLVGGLGVFADSQEFDDLHSFLHNLAFGDFAHCAHIRASGDDEDPGGWRHGNLDKLVKPKSLRSFLCLHLYLWNVFQSECGSFFMAKT